MRATYKNKKEQFKAEAAENLRIANANLSRAMEAEKKLKAIEEKKKDRYSCMVFCPSCLNAGRVDAPRGVAIGDSGCAWCGAKGNVIVKKIHGLFDI